MANKKVSETEAIKVYVVPDPRVPPLGCKWGIDLPASIRHRRNEVGFRTKGYWVKSLGELLDKLIKVSQMKVE